MIIPTRNRWAMLSCAALATSLAQQDVELEVVIVDDGSTDETPVQLAGAIDPRVRVVRRDRSGGMAVARNAGIEVAGGEWIAFLDDDDLWAPRKLRAQIDAARAVDAGFAYAGVIAVDEQGRALADLFLPTADGARVEAARGVCRTGRLLERRRPRRRSARARGIRRALRTCRGLGPLAPPRRSCARCRMQRCPRRLRAARREHARRRRAPLESSTSSSVSTPRRRRRGSSRRTWPAMRVGRPPSEAGQASTSQRLGCTHVAR